MRSFDAAFCRMMLSSAAYYINQERQGKGEPVCDMSPDYSRIMGRIGVSGFYITTGWGTWGFNPIPAGGGQMAELIATGEVPELIAPFGIDRFARDRMMASQRPHG